MRDSKLYTAEGIVIRRQNTGEADRILTIFTKRYGKIRAMAKGIRRVPSRRAGHLEVFSHARVSLYRGKTFDIVTEASTVTTIVNLNHLTTLSHAYYTAELIDRLIPEEEEHDIVFQLFYQTLQRITHAPSDTARAVYIQEFALELLWQ